MTVSVLVPWRAGCEHRERAWAWVQARYTAEHPDWELVEGHSPDGPFSRSAGIIDAARRATGDLLVVADSDVWCDDIAPTLYAATVSGWAVPHRLVHRLSPLSSELVLDGADWRGLPLSTDNPQDARPYRGHATGTLVVLRTDVLATVPPDARFAGWGQEDDAWSCALHVLVGKPWRGTADLFHLWHPAQERRSRRVGNDANFALYRRYRAARTTTAMRALVDESLELAGR